MAGEMDQTPAATAEEALAGIRAEWKRARQWRREAIAEHGKVIKGALEVLVAGGLIPWDGDASGYVHSAPRPDNVRMLRSAG